MVIATGSFVKKGANVYRDKIQQNSVETFEKNVKFYPNLTILFFICENFNLKRHIPQKGFQNYTKFAIWMTPIPPIKLIKKKNSYGMASLKWCWSTLLISSSLYRIFFSLVILYVGLCLYNVGWEGSWLYPCLAFVRPHIPEMLARIQISAHIHTIFTTRQMAFTNIHCTALLLELELIILGFT